jgi:hypothetical protein
MFVSIDIWGNFVAPGRLAAILSEARLGRARLGPKEGIAYILRSSQDGIETIIL